MEDAIHQNAVDTEMNHDSIEENSDSEEDTIGEEVDFDEITLQKLKENDPAISNLCIQLNCDHNGKCFFSDIDWEKDGDCITGNTHLKCIHILATRRSRLTYILGEQGNKLPTRQQLQDFFSCIHRNCSIKELAINAISISEEFGCSLIEGLQSHPSLERLEIRACVLGNKGCTALGKLLKHSTSKVKEFSLYSCNKLDDEGLGIISDSILGNSRLKSFCLNGNNLKITITSSGWRALSTVLQHPNCKLTCLNLSNANIDSKGANTLGTALRGSTVKELNLSHNRHISSAGWQTLLDQLRFSTSIEILKLSNNMIDDGGLDILADMCGTFKSLSLNDNNLIGDSLSDDPGEVWQWFFNSMQRRGTRLKKLYLSNNYIDNGGISALGSLLRNMSTLKTLELECMSKSMNFDESNITPQGWVLFFNSLQDSNLDLVHLSVDDNSIDNEGLQLLVRLVSNMTSLKVLWLSRNRMVTPSGWQALSDYLQSPNFALEELHLGENRINDDTVIAFTSALTHNTTLERLTLGGYYDDDIDDEDEDVGELNQLITDRGWEAVSSLLCNKTSIMDTYNCNHSLQHLPDELADCLGPYLLLNKNKDKVEVARQKVLQIHFSDDDHDSKMQVLLDMELEMMPIAIEWMGRPTHDDWRGTSVSGLGLLYNLMRRLPDLFDSSAQKKFVGERKGKADL